MNLTITGYSTALFSSWYFIEELGLLFDVGDGITSALLQKSRKINHVFVSHADRDHLTGLHQFNQLNAREGFPIIHFPKDCGSFYAIENFSKKFDPHVSGTIWKPIIAGDKTWIRDDLYVEAKKNNHVPAAEGIHKSFGYKVVLVKKKLKPELISLPQNEIVKIIREQGKENTLVEVLTTLFCYSGDTPAENFDNWHNSEILIHEATFLGGDGDAKIHTHGNKHSTLEDVIKGVSTISINKLILGHFSSRYSDEQIDDKIKYLCKEYALNFPVYRVLPGRTIKDILNQEPVHN
ncbi:MAG: RNAse Z [Bacteroidia bacterium]|nr:RNAse Z [Bacteroidia bacterium]